MRYAPVALVALVALSACKKEEEEDEDALAACEPGDASSCAAGQACEPVVGSDEELPDYACFDPVTLRGAVFDALDETAIEGARVVPLDANGSVAGRVGVTDAEGNYAIAVSMPRDPEGEPVGTGSVTLRADADGYLSFPGGLRTALPISLDERTAEETGGWTIATPLTDIGLVPLDEGAPTGQISGTVSVPDDKAGVLVVAEQGDLAVTAVADSAGSYRIFNVPGGSWSVTGYALGVQHEVVTADLDEGGEAVADVGIEGPATSIVSGSVNIVNAPGDAATSVILMVASTFDPFTGRGQAPPGMRAPRTGDPSITSAYEIAGVPDGSYVVLGAFEDDGLVRDPDTSQGGTATQFIDVVGGDVTVEGFKITEALEVLSPGGDGPEIVDAEPVLTWVDDSGEKSYDIVVFDALGNIVWEHTIDGVSGSDPEVPYAGDPLEPGMYYQFRVTSIDNGGVPISRTQDLDGVFQLAP